MMLPMDLPQTGYAIRCVRFWEPTARKSRMRPEWKYKRTKTWRIVTSDGKCVDSFLSKEAAERKLAQLTGA